MRYSIRTSDQYNQPNDHQPNADPVRNQYLPHEIISKRVSMVLFVPVPLPVLVDNGDELVSLARRP
jgi:hypothetical protein